MPDIVDGETRSRMMAGIKSANTQPEITIRKALHARGFRYRLHPRNVPGKPDMVFPRYQVALFVNGCFWHGHDCHLFRLPGTRTEFWAAKIGRNRQRDLEVRRELCETSWRALTIWECSVKGKEAREIDSVVAEVEMWLVGNGTAHEIRGVVHGTR